MLVTELHDEAPRRMSTSSRTTARHWSSRRAPFTISSLMRPGVPTTTSTPCGWHGAASSAPCVYAGAG